MTPEPCSGCRFIAENRDDCLVFGDPMPAQFLRRPAGMCGPAYKLFEQKHVDVKPEERRK